MYPYTYTWREREPDQFKGLLYSCFIQALFMCNFQRLLIVLLYLIKPHVGHHQIKPHTVASSPLGWQHFLWNHEIPACKLQNENCFYSYHFWTAWQFVLVSHHLLYRMEAASASSKHFEVDLREPRPQSAVFLFDGHAGACVFGSRASD